MDIVVTTAPSCLLFRHMLQGQGQWLVRHTSVRTRFLLHVELLAYAGATENRWTALSVTCVPV